jgi:hypothetical protein
MMGSKEANGEEIRDVESFQRSGNWWYSAEREVQLLQS